MNAGEARQRPRGWGAGTAAIFFSFIFAAVPMVATGQPSLPGIIGHDDRHMLRSTEWPWTAIGRLNMQGTGFCTGTLVEADKILTAAHCLLNRATGRLYKPEAVTFVAGYDRGQYRGLSHVKTFKTPCMPILPLPRQLDKMDCDIAILQLTDPIRNTKPLAMVKERARQATHSHSALLLAGYQQDRPYMLSLDARCRLVKWVGKGVFLHDCDGVKGASGAPLISRQGDKFMIVGVHLGFIEPTASLSEAGVGTAWPSRSPG